MGNKLLDIINSNDHALNVQTEELGEALNEVDNLTYRQIKNVISALLEKLNSLQKGYKISIGINSSKQRNLKEQLGQLKEEQKAETISEMIAVLADEGYEVQRNERPSVRIFNDDLPDFLKNKIVREKADYERRLALVMETLKKGCE